MTKARDLANFVSTENELTILDKVTHSGDTNTAIRFPAADTVTVETSGAERLRITSAGNVGIGTSSPLAPLHVATNASGMGLIAGSGVRQLVESSGPAAIQIASGGTTHPAYLFLGANGNAQAARISAQIGYMELAASGASDYMAFRTGGFSERMRITSAGNVGIGTSSPSTRLHVSGDTTFGGATIETVFALSGTTPALDPSNGTIQTWTLSGNSSPTDSLVAGEAMTLMIDDGTAYTITWPSVTWKTDGGNAPTLNTTGFTAVILWKVSTTLYGARVGDA